MKSIEDIKEQLLIAAGQSEIANKAQVVAFFEEFEQKQAAFSAHRHNLPAKKAGAVLYLDLSDSALTAIPDNLRNMPQLKALDLSYNNIIDFQGIESLTALEILILEGCHLKTLPSEIFRLQKLFCLVVRNNELFYLTGRIGALRNLVVLDLSTNLLSSLPEQVGLCENLVMLQAQKNRLSRIPDEIGNLPHLQELNLFDNQLRTIPASLGNCTSLRYLTLMFNELTRLPDEIENLKHLQKLNIANNRLEDLPAGIAQLPCLNNINYADNPFPHLPALQNKGSQELAAVLVESTALEERPVSIIPPFLQSAFQEYLRSFSEYVRDQTGKRLHFDITVVREGFKITTNHPHDISNERIDTYLREYIGDLKAQAVQYRELTEQSKKDRYELVELRQALRDTQAENQQLRDKNETYYEKILLLKGTIKEQQELIDSLKFQIKSYQNPQAGGNTPVVLQAAAQAVETIDIQPTREIRPAFAPHTTFDPDKLLLDLVDKATRMLERKYTKKLEDLHNDEFTDFLRDRGYYISDQSRSGRSRLTAGEVDIMVRNANGTPGAIVEAFRLNHCGPQSKVVGEHLYKLLHHYDTAGHKVNYVLVYSENRNFARNWNNYFDFVESLNEKELFSYGRYPLISFSDTRLSDKTDIKVGLAKHKRESDLIKVYHIFINMYVE